MIALFFSALALLGADHHEATDSGCGYSTNGTIEDQFDRCLAGEWSYEDDCSGAAAVTHEGFFEPDGDFCPIDYLIRDPHTGGFRIGFQCPGEEREVTVLIVENGIVQAANDTGGFDPVARQCAAQD